MSRVRAEPLRSVRARPALGRRVIGGIALTDALIAAPLVLWLGLSVFQWGLVFHGRYAVSHALNEAARAGSVQHADPEAIESGLARGLVPYLFGSADVAERALNLGRAREHVTRGQALGWIRWTQLSPTAQSFADWGVPAVDDEGRTLEGQVEIPIDSLRHRAGSTRPAGGTAGTRGREAIGASSGQTLADANLLRIEMVYGVPLSVPLVGRLAAWVMREVDGCGGSGAREEGAEATGAGGRRLGLIDLGRPARGEGRAWACAHYEATDESGRSQPRWPVQMSVVVRMQSPARHAGVAGVTVAGASAGGRGGTIAGTVDEGRVTPDGRFNAATTPGRGGAGGGGAGTGAGTEGDAGEGGGEADALDQLPGGQRPMSGNTGSVFGLGSGDGRVPLGICEHAPGARG